MAEYQVMLYKNTGFNSNNIPDSPALIDTISEEHKTSVPSLFLNQNNDLSTIKVQGTWEGLKNVDYCKIGDCYYFVTNVFMFNDDVCQLSLQLDPITTIQIANMDFIDGWCSRRIIPQSEQSISNYNMNIIPEDWTQQQSCVMDFAKDLAKQSLGGDVTNYDFVLATVDLIDIQAKAVKYSSEGTDTLSVAVPQVATLPYSKSTVFQMNVPSDVVEFKYPNGALYFEPNDKVTEGLAAVRSLGVESAIIGSYSIPVMYVEGTDDDNGRAIKIIGKSGISSIESMKYEYYDFIENKKVFALYNTFELVSVAGSNSAQYEFEAIYHQGDTYPSFYVWSDPSPNGSPFIRPEWYYGNDTNFWTGSIKGAGWLNNQVVFNIGSGIRQDYVSINRNIRQTAASSMIENISSLSSVGLSTLGMFTSGKAPSKMEDISGATSGFGTAIGQANKAINNYFTAFKSLQDFANKAVQFAPTIIYPYTSSIQSYVGNDFNIIRYRLTENDARRFDNYLHRYGERVDEPFKKEYLHKKQQYDFIQMSNCQIKSNAGIRFNQQAESMFNGGIRIWHTLPNKEALQTGGNPDVS